MRVRGKLRLPGTGTCTWGKMLEEKIGQLIAGA